MTVLITGGHLTPALGYIDYVRQHHPTVKFLFVGREFSQLGQKSQEQSEVEKRAVQFIAYNAPRLAVVRPLALIKYGFHFLASILSGLWLLLRHRPTVVLSFGGYVAWPIALASFLLGIPLVTHEQTLVAGQANRLIAHLAQAVAVSNTSSLQFFPRAKAVVTGNPLRMSLLISDKKARAPKWLTTAPTLPILYITGGNQGSYIINRTVQQILPQLTKEYLIIHACGNPSDQSDSYRELQRSAKRLPPAQQKNYYVRTWIPEDELLWLYSHCFAAISRAGANTVAELTLFQIPTIYIPLPFAKHNEQEQNVRPLADNGAAIVLPQTRLTPAHLLEQLQLIKKKHRQFQKQLIEFSPPVDGAEKLHHVVTKLATATAENTDEIFS